MFPWRSRHGRHRVAADRRPATIYSNKQTATAAARWNNYSPPAAWKHTQHDLFYWCAKTNKQLFLLI